MTVDPYEEERQRSLEEYERRERKEKVFRVSDTDRDRAVRQLRQHLAAGRIDMEEFGERMELVYEARTNVDLDKALHQLPFVSTDVAILSSPTPEGREVGLFGPPSAIGGRSFPYHVAAFAAASSALFVVSAVLLGVFGGSLAAALLMLPMAVWGAVLLSRAINEIRRED